MSGLPRVYVLGNSIFANYLAYEIAQVTAQESIPNIVLLLNDQKKLNRFLDNNSKLSRTNNVRGKQLTNDDSIQFMAACSPPTFASGKPATIENMILADTGKKNISNLMMKYRGSLNQSSNILLMNPPVGSVGYLYDKIWKDSESDRPKMLLGMSKWGDSTINLMNERKLYYSVKDEFSAVTPNTDSGKLNLFLGSVPPKYNTFDSELEKKDIEMLYNSPFVNLIQDTPNVSVQIMRYSELMFLRFENLIVNSCIEPLAVLFDCKYIYEITKAARSEFIIKSLIKEQIKIICMAYPSLMQIPASHTAFDEDRLYNIVMNHLRNGRRKESILNIQRKELNQTDIKQLTGYFVRLAYQCNTDCRWNMTISWLIESKIQLGKARALDYHYL